MKATIVTTRLDADALANLDALARAQDRSRAWIIAKAIRRFVDDERALDAFLDEGEEDFARGEYLTHEQFVAEIEARRVHRDAA